MCPSDLCWAMQGCVQAQPQPLRVPFLVFKAQHYLHLEGVGSGHSIKYAWLSLTHLMWLLSCQSTDIPASIKAQGSCEVGDDSEHSSLQ